jgi:hypothetical protein
VSEISDWLTEDHREIERLLRRAVSEASFCPEPFEAMRARLLRHIAIEEKVLLRAARDARGGVPLERAERLRREHGAIAALLVPTPDAALARELESLLGPHETLEEGSGGVYAECDALLADRAHELAAAARRYPAVPMAKHYDGPEVVRTRADALVLAGRMRVGGRTAPVTG